MIASFFRETCQFWGEPYRSYSKPWGGGSFNLLTIWSLILNPSNITWATQDTHPCDIPWNPEWFNRDPYNYGLLKSPCKLVVPYRITMDHCRLDPKEKLRTRGTKSTWAKYTKITAKIWGVGWESEGSIGKKQEPIHSLKLTART